jgi:endoglucanase
MKAPTILKAHISLISRNTFGKKALSLAALLGLGLAATGQAQAAVCSYTIKDDWNTGFVANIKINNNTSTVINGWTVGWQYTANRITNSWNATITGNSPYSATNLSWNSAIQPGQTIEFGFQGNKNNGLAAEVPTVTGAVCSGAVASSTAASSTPASSKPASSKPASSTPTSSIALSSKPASSVAASSKPASSIPASSKPASSTPASSKPASSNAASSTGGGTGTFRVDTSGNITKNGTVLPVKCGNWFGLEGRHEPSNDAQNPSGAPMELYMGNTFWANGGSGTGRTIQQTMTEITGMGINVVRFPIAPQTLNADDPQGKAPFLKNHPSVRATSARQAMEDFIKLADQNNIDLIIDMHSCSNYLGWRAGRLDARPPYVDKDRQGYDFKRENYSCAPAGAGVIVHEYNKTIWLNNLKEIAGLSAKLGVDNILGIDIFNEPWDYTWADWKSLSESAYEAINSVNPNILVVVEGISASANNQDGSPASITVVPHGSLDTTPNWGENLFEVGTNPLTIPKSRLILSPHTYGPSVFVQKHFMDPAQPQCAELEGEAAGDAKCNIVINPTRLRAGWDEHFGYLKAQGYAMVVGEFGGNLDWPGKATVSDQNRWSHITAGVVDGQWQDAFVDYMVEKKIQGCYWSINPESGDTGGWYGHAYDPVSNTAGWGEWRAFDNRKTNLLNRLWTN